MLFPVLTALYSGASDERVDVWRCSPASPALYRSLRGLPFRRLGEAAVSAAYFVKGAEMAAGDAACWSMDRASSFPRRESTASFDSRPEELGARPRPTFLQRPNRLGLGIGRLLWLDTKRLCDGAPPDLGGGGCS